MNRRRVQFTLLEVVVAIGVLALSLTALFTLSASAQRRLIRAEEDWCSTHWFIQGAEYYLLQPDDAEPPPPEIFPGDTGYRLQVDYPDAEGLPESLESGELFTLRSCQIELIREDTGEVVHRVIVDRYPLEEEDLP